MTLENTLALVRSRGAGKLALCAFDPPPRIEGHGLPGILLHGPAVPRNAEALNKSGWSLAPISNAPPELDAVIVLEREQFGAAMRQAEPLSRRGVLIVPAESDTLVDATLQGYTALDTAWKTSPDANYVARCALRGHYLEFGTWYGRSFFPAYFRLRGWLRGKFFAFDSFAGLSTPLPLESEFTGGDFYAGGYCCNRASFETMCSLVGMPAERLHIVEGFYDTTLRRHPSEYGLEPGSVSVCVIDCDLREPTVEVLRFVTPLLEPGALIYFDDWRLTRASAVVGERAAALEWLKANPDIELIDFHRDHWQHQWFIFQRG